MKFFIDTANLDEIKEAQDLGVLDGVTTNPSLMAKEGITGKKNILNHYKEICKIVDGDVSAEVISTDYEGMIKEGKELAKLNDQIVVKIPMTRDGVKACKYFTENGIRTNVTLVFSVGQALLAAKAGATYVSPFLGRLCKNRCRRDDRTFVFHHGIVETSIDRHRTSAVSCRSRQRK